MIMLVVVTVVSRKALQSGHRQRTPPSPGQGPCVSLGFLVFSLVSMIIRCISMGFQSLCFSCSFLLTVA